MLFERRWWRSTELDRGTALPMALLVLAVLLSAVLAYEAAVGAIERRRATERALGDHARFAAWELAGRIDEGLARIAEVVASSGTTSTSDHPAALRELLREAGSACECYTLLTAAVVRMRPVSVVAVQGRALPAGFAQVIGRAIDPAFANTAHNDAEQLHNSAPIDAGLSRAVRLEARILRIGPSKPSPSKAGGTARSRAAVVIHVPSMLPSAATATTVMVAPADELAAALLRASVRGAPLFPASLTRGLPNDEVLFVTLVNEHGDTLFRSQRARVQRNATIEGKVPFEVAAGRTAAVGESLEGVFGGLRVAVALYPDAAPWISGANLPGRGLRYVTGILLLTVSLVGVAIHQLRRQQELARLRAGFVSGVSHELRTPLAQIRLFADLLESEQLSHAQRRRAAQIINAESQRLGYLVENVLRYSRAERATERINPVPIDLSVLADDVVHALSPLVRARDARIERVGSNGVEALADPDALRQVLINLLDNAAKYGPPGQRIQVGVSRDGAYATFWVDDEGPGIPADERETVWAAFRRLDRDVESATGGSGIGLSVVRELVRLHEGVARITDAPGGGTRVVVTLPALAGNGAEAHP